MRNLASTIINRQIDEEHLLENPFPGLRPFNIEESHLFFGREGQTDEVLMKLSENRFVGIIGPSGSGKSSFVYCGVLPILYGGFLAHKSPNWNVIVSRPGAAPIDNLAEAIVDSDDASKDMVEGDRKMKKTIISSLLKTSSLGLVEAIMQSKEAQDKNYLILVDQFEELFRFKSVDAEGNSINESMAFVNLLMEAVQNVKAPIYVAITMRSDFIGDCAEFPELTKSINDSHYLIPQMTRDQKRMAILGPVAVGGGQITPRLVQELLNDVGEKSDQLPILQHALMRTWAFWRDNREGSEPIDIHHYEAIGTMSEALSRHANEAYEELNESQKRICEIMFKSLVEKRGEGEGIRRPTKLAEVAALADVKENDVIAVVEKFREPGRSLVTPPSHVQLSAETYVDVSHESLMRIWERLKTWADEEGESGRMYLRLCEASAMFQVGKAGLWRPPDLQLALNWQQKHKPTLIWANRYHPAFERGMVFLENSKKEWDTEQKQKELQQKRTLKRAKVTALIMATAAVISLAGLVFAFIQMTIATQQTLVADQKTIEAQEQKVIADENADKAEISAEEAFKAQGEAEISAAKAVKAQGEAEISAEEARLAQGRAEISAEEALRQQGIAEQRQEEAVLARENEANQRKAADEARVRAEHLRTISIAKAMAIKSQTTPDIELKGLLAQQAYVFNVDHGGYEYDLDIYDGLYYSIKDLKGGETTDLIGHKKAVRALTSSSSGNFIYSAGSDGQVNMWLVNQAQIEPTQIVLNTYTNKAIALSHDDQTLAVGGNSNNIQIFDLDNLDAEPRIFETGEKEVRFIAYNHDNSKIVFVGDEGGVFKIENGRIDPIENTDLKITSMAMHPLQDLVLVGYNNGDIAKINLASGNYKEIIYQDPGGSKLYTIAYSHFGNYIAVGEESGIINIWQADDLTNPLATLAGHEALIRDLEFSRDGKQLASASMDGSVRIWNMEDLNQQPIVLRDNEDWVWSVTFGNQDSRLYVGCKEQGVLRQWPTRVDMMSEFICNNVTRNLTPNEWDTYVAQDIPYQTTCPALVGSK